MTSTGCACAAPRASAPSPTGACWRGSARPAAAIAALPELARAGGRVATVASVATAEAELAALRRHGGQLLFVDTPDYPPYLAATADAPPVLAVLGDVALLRAPSLGIVGARNASANGMRLAADLASSLAPQLVIVSGLARGIDASAHKGALATGRTIAAIARRDRHRLPAGA